MIWAIVLAAGESRRMGTQKLLLPFGDVPVIGAVVRTAAESRVDRTMVVLGADRDAIRAGLGSLMTQPGNTPVVDFTINDDYRLGMLTSIQAGLRALPAGATAAVIMLGDQPFLRAAAVDAVIAAHGAGGRGIVIPTFRGRRGHPVLIDLKYRGEVLALDPLAGLRALMRRHAEDILEVEVADPNVLRDLDTPEDYAGLPKPN